MAAVALTGPPALAAGTQESEPSAVVSVKFREALGLRVENGVLRWPSGVPDAVLGAAVRPSEAYRVRRLFAADRALQRLRADAPTGTGGWLADLASWIRITAPSPGEAHRLVATLNARPEVDTAYIFPAPAPPPGGFGEAPDGTPTPDLTARQTYFGPAPVGVDTRFARTIEGGDGRGVRIADVENDWFFEHEDLQLPPWVLLAGEKCADGPDDCFTDHGTGVLGILAARVNGFGIEGGAPGAGVSTITPRFEGGYDPASAILFAGSTLDRGDILLIELQARGPGGSAAFAPIEWIPEVYDAVRALTEAGRIVIEPAGNGGRDLDRPEFQGRFHRSLFDSGAIIVGAGDSLRAITRRSNFGSRIDVQAWGCCVTTTGVGSLRGTGPADSYRSDFGGTSGASAIVAAAAAAIQGILKEGRGVTLNSRQMRSLLAGTGSAQTGDLSRRIGPLPNLRQAVERLELDARIDVTTAVNDLLAGGLLSETDRRRLDLLGNTDGRFNLGDVAALIERNPDPIVEGGRR